jgi:hypothetical protein
LGSVTAALSRAWGADTDACAVHARTACALVGATKLHASRRTVERIKEVWQQRTADFTARLEAARPELFVLPNKAEFLFQRPEAALKLHCPDAHTWLKKNYEFDREIGMFQVYRLRPPKDGAASAQGDSRTDGPVLTSARPAATGPVLP